MRDNLEGITWNEWARMSPEEQKRLRDNSDLSPQLEGLEGYRVEVVDADGNKRRFQVGKSTGWRPCHLELYNARSMGGDPADKVYQSVTILRKVR